LGGGPHRESPRRRQEGASITVRAKPVRQGESISEKDRETRYDAVGVVRVLRLCGLTGGEQFSWEGIRGDSRGFEKSLRVRRSFVVRKSPGNGS